MFESQHAYKLLGIKECDRASSWEMLHGDAYHKKTFSVGVVQGNNRSTITTGKASIKNGGNMHVQGPYGCNIIGRH